jgi:membrane fusion protein (multidrug efflux system)
VDGQLVTAILQDVEPTDALAVPRAAVLADQEGDYVFVVGKDDKAEKRRVKLGQSTPAFASIVSGLTDGESVIVDGIQRVRSGQPVSPGPPAAQVQPPPGTSTPGARP